MNHEKKLYLCATGMLTAIGDSVEMTAASVKAGMSGFDVSDYKNQHQENITMAGVPQSIFESFDFKIDMEGNNSEHYERVLKMGLIAAIQIFERQAVNTPVPLILATSETLPNSLKTYSEALLTKLIQQAN